MAIQIDAMKTTTVFKIGNSLCVRLPAGFKLPVGKVYISKGPEGIHLQSNEHDWPLNVREMFAPDPVLADWERPKQGRMPKIKEL